MPNRLNFKSSNISKEKSYYFKNFAASKTPNASLKILLRYTRFPLGLFHSKSYVVGCYIYNGKDEHPCIVTIKITSVSTVAKSCYFLINQIQVTNNK